VKIAAIFFDPVIPDSPGWHLAAIRFAASIVPLI